MEPYVGVFNKRAVDSEHQVVKSLDELHDVGVFAQIHEVHDMGSKIRLVATAHRRIRLQKQIKPDVSLKDKGLTILFIFAFHKSMTTQFMILLVSLVSY